MSTKKHDSFGKKAMGTVGKLAVAAAFFPYQIVVNRKDGQYSVRSLAVKMLAKRVDDENGKKHHEFSWSWPGCSVQELKTKAAEQIKKYKKKRIVLNKKSVKGSEQ